MSKPPFLSAEDLPVQGIAMIELILPNISLLGANGLSVDAVCVPEGVEVEEHSFDRVGIIVVKPDFTG